MKNWFLSHNESPLALPAVWGIQAPYHPSVLYFAESWNGYNYWMAETPFPFLPKGIYRDRYECPCIHVSNDGIHWSDVDGLTNPIADLSQQEIADFDFYSDPHLLMNDDRMECWFRISRRHGKNEYHAPDTETFLLRMTTSDGVTWTKPEVLINLSQVSKAELVSPAVIFEGNKYLLWLVSVDKIKDVYSVVKLTSSDAKKWSSICECNLAGIDFKPWHIDVQHFDNKYQLVIFGLKSTMSLTLWQSDNGGDFMKAFVFPVSIGHQGSFYEQRLYRAALCKVSDSDYRLYFSANDTESTHIGLLQGRSLHEMSIIDIDNNSYRSLFSYLSYMTKKVKRRVNNIFSNILNR